jgi:hypothetical protein
MAGGVYCHRGRGARSTSISEALMGLKLDSGRVWELKEVAKRGFEHLGQVGLRRARFEKCVNSRGGSFEAIVEDEPGIWKQ